MEKTIIKVSGMSCAHCEKTITNVLSALDGVSHVNVDLTGNSVAVEYDNSKVSLDVIKTEIVDAGYDVN